MISEVETPAPPKNGPMEFITARAPGCGLMAGLAVASEHLGAQTSLSPLLWATMMGMAMAQALKGSQSGRAFMLRAQEGVGFTKGRLLRAGIVLYGVKLTLQQVRLVEKCLCPPSTSNCSTIYSLTH